MSQRLSFNTLKQRKVNVGDKSGEDTVSELVSE